MSRVFIDSNVFVIDLRYPRDLNAEANRSFLQALRDRGNGVTSLLNLLEIVGILSFNLNPRQLQNLFRLFPDRYRVTVLPSAEPDTLLPRWNAGQLVSRISRGLSLGDAMILEHAESRAWKVDTIVSWDAPHFQGKTHLQVQTPTEFLQGL